MKKSFSLLFFVVASFLSHTVFAQTKTPYQQKTESLAMQLLKDIGSSPAAMKKYAEGGTVGGILLFGDMTQKLLNTEKGVLALQRYKGEMKKAESLKNSVDHKREEDKRLAQQRKNKIQLEKQSVEKKKQLEEQNIEKTKKEFEISDYYTLSEEIKKEYEKWTPKGEFEKTTEYESRINTESSKEFQRVCFNAVYDKIYAYDSSYVHKAKYQIQYHIEIELGDYDADKELFNATLNILKDYNRINVANAVVNIPMNEAEVFKVHFSNFGLATQSYRFFVNMDDWCFANNNLVPKKIIIKEKEKNSGKTYTLTAQLDSTQNVIFNTEVLKIKNVNATFNYNKEASAILESVKKAELLEDQANQREREEKYKKEREKEEKELEIQKKQDDEQMFATLVRETDNVVFAEKFKGKKPKEIAKADYGDYVRYNKHKVVIYQRALKIKEDAEVRKKMEECQADAQQTQALEDKKQKQNKTMKTLGNIISR